MRRALAAAAVVAASLGLYTLSASAEPTKGYRWALPANFPKPAVPSQNPMTPEKVELGRRLFYDERLSGNGTQSCASCHSQERAFTDGRAQAVGSTGETHPRSAQSLVNVVYQSTMTWANPSLASLEQQMQVPLFNQRPVEMGITDANKGEVLARLARDPVYKRGFARAFPGRRRPLNYTSVIRAIAAFQRSIVSADSKYDRSLRGRAKLTTSERRGAKLFLGERAECHHCHGSFIFNDQTTYQDSPRVNPQFHNNGLYSLGGTGAYPEPNTGVFDITSRDQDMGRFKAPSLRNVALTAPYMHDGSIATLREVVDHYAAGGRVIADGPNAGDGRANPNKDPEVSGIDLSLRDRDDLVAFLESLTDRTVTKDPRFADPFKRRR